MFLKCFALFLSYFPICEIADSFKLFLKDFATRRIITTFGAVIDYVWAKDEAKTTAPAKPGQAAT